MNKREVLFLVLASFIFTLIDFFNGCRCGGNCKLLIFNLSYLDYFLTVYPLTLLLAILYPLIFERNKYKVLSYFFFIWAMNDFLWFLVNPSEWNSFWQFKNKLIYFFPLFRNVGVYVLDWVMALSIFLRVLLALAFYDEDFVKKWRLYFLKSIIGKKKF